AAPAQAAPAQAAPASSAPPAAPSEKPPASLRSSLRIGDLTIDEVEALSDLPPEIQVQLCREAVLTELGVEEETAGFGVALVISGSAAVCPAVADTAAAHVSRPVLVSAIATFDDVTSVRIVATEPTRIATWPRATFETLLRDCPWVLDDLRDHGNRFAALAG